MAGQSSSLAPKSPAWWKPALFFLVLFIGLWYVKWQPYYGKAFTAAQTHSIGNSILANAQDNPLRAALDYAAIYFLAVWKAAVLGVLLGSSLGQFVCTFAPFSPQSLSLIALMATLAILISYMFVFNENDLIALAKGDEDKDVAEPKRQRFQDRCKDVAGEYGLSPKETEIMILFAKGRSSTRIQEELYLSRGTVTTHLRHIYQKMDVHGKQEFLDVIEGRE